MGSGNRDQWEKGIVKQDEKILTGQNKNVDDPEPVDDSTNTGGWKQHAGFSIFFDYKLDENGHKHWHTRVWKTTTYHEESGDVKELDGIDSREWVNWILEKSGLDAEKILGEPEVNEELEKSQLSTVSVEIQMTVTLK